MADISALWHSLGTWNDRVLHYADNGDGMTILFLIGLGLALFGWVAHRIRPKSKASDIIFTFAFIVLFVVAVWSSVV